MKSLIVITFFLLGTMPISAQIENVNNNILSYESCKPFVFNFKIENGVITGKESEKLSQAINNSQFFILGETHFSSQTSILTNALLPLLKNSNYEKFAIEVGPHSANILKRLSTKHEETINNLHAFNTKYYFPEDDGTPIPFFEGVEDAQFLATASKLGFDLWGLDQEFLFANFHLFDELFELTDRNQKVLGLKQKIDKEIYEYHKKNATLPRSKFNLYDSLLSNQNIDQFFKEMSKQSSNAKKIIEDIKISWDIYSRSRRWGAHSHLTRVSYIRKNFLENYRKAGNDAKVFVKIGGLHAGKDKELKAYDIGNLAHELAVKNGTNCTNIHVVRRFYESNGKVKDYWEQRDKIISFDFTAFGQKDQWAMVDLASLRNKLHKDEISLPDDISFHILKRYIQNYDMLLIPPLDRKQKPNYILPEKENK